MNSEEKTLIGYAEYVDFTDWGVRFRAKADTGARTSALHVDNIERISKHRVRFDIVRARDETGLKRKTVEAPIARVSTVKSSNGMREERFIVTAAIKLGDVEKDIELSLTSRGEMIYRMLIGRLALAPDFVVDAGRRYVATKKRKTTKRKTKKKTKRRAS